MLKKLRVNAKNSIFLGSYSLFVLAVFLSPKECTDFNTEYPKQGYNSMGLDAFVKENHGRLECDFKSSLGF